MKRAIETSDAPKAYGPYSQGIVTQPGEIVFVSGQIAPTPEGEPVPSIEEETRQIMRNIQAILGAAALSFSDVVQSRVYLTDIGQFGPVNAVYDEFVSEPYPARECVIVAGIPKPGARLEIAVTAIRASSES